MAYQPGFFECETCGIPGQMTDDDIEENAEFAAPVGWVEVIVRRKIPSAAYAEEVALQQGAIDQLVAQNMQLAQQQGESVTEQDMRGFAQRQVNMQMPARSAEFEVDETTLHYCPQHAHVAASLDPFTLHEFLGLSAPSSGGPPTTPTVQEGGQVVEQIADAAEAESPTPAATAPAPTSTEEANAPG